jgi:tRNA modification GTPase
VSGPLSAPIARAMLGELPAPRHAAFATFRASNGDAIDEGIALS